MCACQPKVRTPNCGSMACIRAAAQRERARISSWLRREASVARHMVLGPVDRDVVADAIANWIESGEWETRTENLTAPLASADTGKGGTQ